jgi:hypothetical protein
VFNGLTLALVLVRVSAVVCSSDTRFIKGTRNVLIHSSELLRPVTRFSFGVNSVWRVTNSVINLKQNKYKLNGITFIFKQALSIGCRLTAEIESGAETSCTTIHQSQGLIRYRDVDFKPCDW